MKKIILCNVAVTFLIFWCFFAFKVNAQTNTENSINPLETVLKSFLPDPAKEIFDIADQAKKKMESKLGVDLEKMVNSQVLGTNAGSSQKLTPESTMNLLEKVSELISTTNPAAAPDFVGRVTDIIKQFIQYIFDIMRKIIEMI